MHLASGITLLLPTYASSGLVPLFVSCLCFLSLCCCPRLSAYLPTQVVTSTVPTPQRLPRPGHFCSSRLPLNSYLRPSSQRRLNVARNGFSFSLSVALPAASFRFRHPDPPSDPPDGPFPYSNARPAPAFATSALLCSRHPPPLLLAHNGRQPRTHAPLPLPAPVGIPLPTIPSRRHTPTILSRPFVRSPPPCHSAAGARSIMPPAQ